jgi:glutathione S-transferase
MPHAPNSSPVYCRAEIIRIILNYGGIPFEDFTFKFEAWPEYKPKMPFGQVPVLEVDGEPLAQSTAIQRYAAKLAGLIPEDLFAAAKVDEAHALIAEMQDVIAPTNAVKDPEAKIKARQEAIAGPLKEKLSKLASLLTSAGGKFLTGDAPTYADIAAYKFMSGLVGGTMDGIPTDVFDEYPELKAFHKRVAELPPIKKMYENVTEGPRLSYKALP